MGEGKYDGVLRGRGIARGREGRRGIGVKEIAECGVLKVLGALKRVRCGRMGVRMDVRMGVQRSRCGEAE